MSSDIQTHAALTMDSAMVQPTLTNEGAVQGRPIDPAVRADRIARLPPASCAGALASKLQGPTPKVEDLSDDREEPTTPTSSTDGSLSYGAMRSHGW